MGGYNHYSWCNCGWCVKDRGGYRYTSPEIKVVTKSKIVKKNGNEYKYLSKIETYESFTVPNIKCKCCGEEIFFYQSPYGGKVFFNELGHPWEKHCCEPECCAKKIENIPHEVLNKDRIVELIKEPFWKKDGWTPAIYIKEEYYDYLIKKITFKAMNNYQEYSFFVKNKQFSLFKIKEGLAINFRPINETFFEISFYLDDRDRRYIIIASISLNFNNLDSLNLVEKNNLTNIKLAEVFFKILNISNNYRNEKQQIYELVINHKNSKDSGMSDVYEYINRFGIQKFEKDFSNSFKYYDEKIIDIFSSIKDISTLNNIHRIILEENQEKINIENSKKNKKNKSNIKKKKWKNISIYKPKKRLTFVEKK